MKLTPHMIRILGAWIALTGCEIQGLPTVAVQLLDQGPNQEACLDADGDGFATNCGEATDCDDENEYIFPGASELCDGADNNCNDLVDEGLGGGACSDQTGQCQGIWACTLDEFHVTRLLCVLNPQFIETCNAIDDDCDGQTDEDNPGGGALCETIGEGQCGGGTFQCSGGALGCVANTTPGANPEICNNFDDDCDGVIDEGPGGSAGVPSTTGLTKDCYFGGDDTDGVGSCKPGSWTCEAGEWGHCFEEIRPVAEVCDGIDNDCNGAIDDTLLGCQCEIGTPDESCYGGPVGTQDVGLCHPGSQVCDGNGIWSACSHVAPAPELCDGLDNNCDSQIDDGFNLGDVCTAGVGTCVANGTIVCDANSEGAICDAVPGEPADSDPCDGLDNDCDDRIDETDGAASACTSGDGVCARDGVLVCVLPAEGGPVPFSCNAEPGPSSAEVCDGLDNDCDGSVDEDFDVGGVCIVGVGACERQGVNKCSGIDLTGICDVQPGGPSPEVCDGFDNDCDGEVDEAFGVGNVCAAVGVCGVGVLECNAVGTTRCSTRAGGSADQSSAESCDGVDNNCDGQVDEYWQQQLTASLRR